MHSKQVTFFIDGMNWTNTRRCMWCVYMYYHFCVFMIMCVGDYIYVCGWPFFHLIPWDKVSVRPGTRSYGHPCSPACSGDPHCCFLRLKFQGAATLPLAFPWVSRNLNTGSQAYMAIALTPSHLPSQDIVLLGYFTQLFIQLTAERYSIGCKSQRGRSVSKSSF